MNLTLFPGYILDADFIIGLGRRFNPPEMRQKARVIVDDLIAKGMIKSPQEVYFELSHKAKDSGDEALKWCNDHRSIFEDLSVGVQMNLAVVLAEFEDMVKSDQGNFDADPILVAMALDSGWTVVTRDGSGLSPANAGVHIVSQHFGVRCITDFDFLKENGWTV
jgi:hypothetical protein